MSVLIALGDRIEIRMIGKISGQTTINSFYYEVTAKVPGVDFHLAALPPIWKQVFFDGEAPDTGLARAISNQWNLSAVVAQVIFQPRSIQMITQFIDVTGDIPSAPLPSGAAVVIRRQGSVGARDNYGRVYIAGVPAENVVQSQLTFVGAGLFGPFVEAMKSDWEVIDPETAAGATLTPIIKPTPITTPTIKVFQTLVDPIIRYQRRREVGVGI